MVERLRPGLYKAYQAEYGSTNIPERVLIPTEEHRKRYRKHGLVSIRVSLDGVPGTVFVNIAAFNRARYAWVSHHSPDSFDILITTLGGSRLPRKYGRDDFAQLNINGDCADGVIASVNYKVALKRQIPYDVKLEVVRIQQPTPTQA